MFIMMEAFKREVRVQEVTPQIVLSQTRHALVIAKPHALPADPSAGCRNMLEVSLSPEFGASFIT